MSNVTKNNKYINIEIKSKTRAGKKDQGEEKKTVDQEWVKEQDKVEKKAVQQKVKEQGGGRSESKMTTYKNE